jgi:hypothetical protein
MCGSPISTVSNGFSRRSGVSTPSLRIIVRSVAQAKEPVATKMVNAKINTDVPRFVAIIVIY